jgi:hypothetical protein
MRPKIFPCLWYIRHKSCSCLALRWTLSANRPKRASTWTTSHRSSIDAPKTISEPITRSVQTVHLSCIDINTVSKWTDMNFNMIHFMYMYHRVCLKWFLSLWYIWRNPCSDLASRLALSPNGPMRASTWPTPPRSTFGWVQNDNQAYGMFGENHAPVMCQD